MQVEKAEIIIGKIIVRAGVGTEVPYSQESGESFGWAGAFGSMGRT